MILGVIHRYRHRLGLPQVHLSTAVVRAKPPKPPMPPKPKSPAAARAIVPAALRPIIGIRARVRHQVVSPVRHVDRTPRCEAVLPDGSPCTCAVLRDAMCMGHLYLADRTQRLRLNTGRYVSRIHLAEILGRALATETHSDSYGRVWTRRVALAGLTSYQVANAISKGDCVNLEHFERLAAEHGWRRINADTYVQVNRDDERRAA